MKRANYRIIFALFVTSTAAIAISSKQTNNDGITEKPLHSLPIKNTEEITHESLRDLLPKPVAKLDEASKSVISSRNPFLGIESAKKLGSNQLPLDLRLTGIARTEDSVVAMISSRYGEQFYEVGNIIANGLKIIKISTDNESIDISNGLRTYTIKLRK